MNKFKLTLISMVFGASFMASAGIPVAMTLTLNGRLKRGGGLKN